MIAVSNPKIANAVMTLAWLLWSLDSIFIRLIGDDVSRPLIAGLSCFIGGVSLLLPSRAFRMELKEIKYVVLMGIYVIFCTICAEISFAYAIKNLNPGLVSLILRSQIVLTILGAWFFFHEKPDKIIYIGLAIVLAGYIYGGYVTISAPNSGESRNATLGIAFSGIACVLWSLATIIGKKLLEKYSPMELSSMRMTLAGIITLAAVFVMNGSEPFVALTSRQWLLLLVKGIICSAMSFTLYFVGLKYSSLTVAAAIEQASPLFTLVIASCILHDNITLIQWIVVLVVTFGASLIVFHKIDDKSECPGKKQE